MQLDNRLPHKGLLGPGSPATMFVETGLPILVQLIKITFLVFNIVLFDSTANKELKNK